MNNIKREGKVKEYYYNYYNFKISFEGELLNGKENRIGKEYFNGKLIFEGQFINDKRNGKGKEYNYRIPHVHVRLSSCPGGGIKNASDYNSCPGCVILEKKTRTFMLSIS